MQFLSNLKWIFKFKWTSRIKMLKMFNWAQIRCPEGFYEEIIAVT